MKKIYGAALASLLLLSSCSVNNDNNGEYIIDVLNRKVYLPDTIEKVVCIGAGALRLYSYTCDLSLLCGVEDIDRASSPIGKNLPLRPYQMVNEEYFDTLPSCGVGGPQGQFGDSEKILACNPDIVISALPSVETNDKLSKQINKPVVCLSYGKTEAFDNKIKESITLLGQIFQKEERSKELTSFIDELKIELNDLTKDIPQEEKPSLYIGCQSNFGAHGIESSTAQYSIFDVSNIKNVLDINGYNGYQQNVDLEKLLKMDPDKIIIDAGGLSIFKQQYLIDEKAAVFNSMSAFKNNEVYLQMPYNGYFTNLEIAYCNAYFAASVSYPDIFIDLDMDKKCEEIFTLFNKTNCYPQIKEKQFGGYQKIDLKEMFEKYE